MAAIERNLEVERGAKFVRKWRRTIKDDGSPIDQTGLEARMHVRAKRGSSVILWKLTSLAETDDVGSITLGETDGLVTMEIGANASSNIEWSTAVYDLEIYDPNDVDNVIRFLQGEIHVDFDVTRA